MESNGENGRIQCSQKTADLLIAAGKASWLTPRKELVDAKGKGKLQCYWVEPGVPSANSATSHTSKGNDSGSIHACLPEIALSTKYNRLVNWNTEMLEKLILQVVNSRPATPRQARTSSVIETQSSAYRLPLDEVTDVVELKRFDSERKLNNQRGTVIQLPPEVRSQLKEYITMIALMYRDNAFHNFEHASHVMMSTTKLLQRVVSQEIVEKSNMCDLAHLNQVDPAANALCVDSYGITTDPLLQFSVAFIALVHDVDHRGVSNQQLVQDSDPLASLYKGKSVAEQNSIDLAFNLFMKSDFVDLRACLFSTPHELAYFRQFLVNGVIATDIFDKDLMAFREERWNQAFPTQPRDGVSVMVTEEEVQALRNRRATIVVEYIIQASDVSHTMQHWKVYQKWNWYLFQEMYAAYLMGRSPKDPSKGWYEGELWFFDNYVIPLAKKLRDCGVFGVSSDEFLDYATDNRLEWASKGREIVEEMINTATALHAKRCEDETN